MSNVVKISAKDVIGHDLCVASTDGDKIYDPIVKAFEDGKDVELSFEGITLITSAFLNAAIGRRYDGKYDEKIIKKSLKCVDIERDDKILIEAVIENAQRYFSNPARYKQVIKTAEES